jgi:GST-like protein
MEVKRQLDVLDRRLGESEYLAGGSFTIADMAVWPWYGGLINGKLYDTSSVFLQVQEYKNLRRWTDLIAERPAVKRGGIVNAAWGDVQLPERHDAKDFEGKAL